MSMLNGQDSVTAGNTSRGLSVYAGYVNGYVSYGAMVARHPGAIVLSISVRDGVYSVDVLDVEPGAATEGALVPFVMYSKHPHANKPIVYCAAWQTQTFINHLAANGIARSRYYIWSAHYGRGEHLCGPQTCGYGQADGTQWGTNAYYDSDIFNSYMFGAPPAPPAPVPVNYPVSLGDTGPLVKAAQNGMNKWVSRTGTPLLSVDGVFGAGTKAAAAKTQAYFYQHGVTAGVVDQWLMDQMAFDLWPIKQGRVGLDVEHLQGFLNKWNGVLKFGANLKTDGDFAQLTADAVAKAQVHFQEHGVTAGQCTQNVYSKLEGNPA